MSESNSSAPVIYYPVDVDQYALFYKGRQIRADESILVIYRDDFQRPRERSYVFKKVKDKSTIYVNNYHEIHLTDLPDFEIRECLPRYDREFLFALNRIADALENL